MPRNHGKVKLKAAALKPLPVAPPEVSGIEPQPKTEPQPRTILGAKTILRWMRSMSVAQAIGWTPFTAAVTALLVLLITRLYTIYPWSFLESERLSKLAVWTLSVSVLPALALAVPDYRLWLAGLRLPKRFSAQGVKSYAFAIQLGVLLLVVPAFVMVLKLPYDYMQWYGYGFLNKRWIFTFYWVAAATFLLFPSFFSYLLKPQARTTPAPLPAGDAADSARSTGSAHPSRAWLRGAGKMALALTLAWFFAGPPWHLERHHRPIDFHEQVHLGPLQAIDKGYLPYIGPASTQYGPGSQLATYLFMKGVGHFDIVGFREGTALLHLVTMIGFCLIAFSLLNVWPAVVVLLLGLAYSPLDFFLWGPDGTFAGFYGWGNGCRYLGVLIVIAGLAWLAQSERKRWVTICLALGLGFVWGLFSWLAQENLSSTVMGAGLLMILLWLTGTASPRTLLHLGFSVCCGFVVFWAPVLSYYASHGAAREFVRFYFLVPTMVVRGFSNTPWPKTDTLEANAFYFMGPFLIIVGMCTLCDPRKLRLIRPLPPARVRLLGFLLALVASYPSALFRSDSSHLLNTLIALPFVIFLACWDLPNWLAAGRPARWTLRIAAILVAFYAFPLRTFLPDILGRVVLRPLARFAQQKQPPARQQVLHKRANPLHAISRY